MPLHPPLRSPAHISAVRTVPLQPALSLAPGVAQDPRRPGIRCVRRVPAILAPTRIRQVLELSGPDAEGAGAVKGGEVQKGRVEPRGRHWIDHGGREC
jgi:hypothetical protein